MSEIKKLKDSQVEFEVTVPWKEWEKYLDLASKEASEEIKIDGFRPGKAPRKIVEQKVGKEALLNSASQKAIEKTYVEFVKENKLEVIGSPEVKVNEMKEGADLSYQVKVSVVPELKLDKKYKKEVKKVNEEFKDRKAEVKEEEIKSELEKIANSRVKLVTVAREAKKDDNVEIDFTVLVNNVPIEGGTSKNHPMVIGKGVFIPGFEENLIGMKAEEEKEFELEFPKDYHKKDLAGKLANFKVKINLVQDRQTPEINDDFAKSLGAFENLEALKKNINEGMLEEGKRKIEEEKKGKYIEKIVECSELDLPEILIAQEIKQMFNEFEYQIQTMGLNLDTYLKQLKKERKELEKDWEPQAKKRVTSALALREIAKAEDIKIDSKEVEEEMNKTMAQYKNVKDMEKNIDMERLYEYTRGNLENGKVFEMLGKI